MAGKVISWNEKEWKQNLSQRMEAARRNRSIWDDQSTTNSGIVYNAMGVNANNQFNITFDNVIELESGDVDEADTGVGTNFTARYVRHRHGQFSANPPAVVVSPTSSDYNDKMRADAADRIVRHGYYDKKAQQLFDQWTLKTLVNGWSFLKIVWDSSAGDMYDFNAETGDVVMEGDIKCYSPATRDIWVDPVASVWEDVRFTFERHYLPMEQARFQFPGATEILKKAIVSVKDGGYNDGKYAGEEIVEVYEYYEKALPVNGMAGRHAYCTASGDLLQAPTKNHHINNKLPYIILTDQEVEDEVYGKSLVEFVARQQEILNRFDSAATDAMHAHGLVRLMVPASTEINDDNISNSSFDIIRYEGAIPPTHMQPPSLPPDLARLRDMMKADIQEMMGINDAQLGNVQRETSGFAQQTAIEAGNTGNRRFFNKYTDGVQEFWRQYLGLVKQHWTVPRTILVLGKEKAAESVQIKGADIAGGFDIKAEYGTSLPLDPNMRREQIMQMLDLLKEAGVPMTRVLKMLKLNDLNSLYDELEQGEDRQREIFDEMSALYHRGEGDAYIAPEELENHEAMLIFAQKFRMSMEYKVLAEDVKLLVEQHIQDRMALAAEVAQGGQAAPPAPEPGMEEMPMIPPPQGLTPVG